MIIASYIKTKKSEVPMTKKQLLTTILLVMAISMTGYSNYAYASVSNISDLTATAVSGGDVDLSWSASIPDGSTDTSVTYDVQVSTTGSFGGEESTLSTGQAGITYTDTTCGDGNTCHYRVIPIGDSSGPGNPSNPDFATADSNKPTPTITATQSSPSNSATLNFQVEYDEVVTGFDDTDLVVSGTLGGTVENFGGSGTTYIFDIVIAGSTEGTILIDIPVDSGGIIDSVGNLNDGATQFSITADRVDPVLTPNQANPVELLVGDIVPTLDVTVSDNDVSVDGDIIACDMSGVSTANVGIDPANCNFTDPSGNDAVQYQYVVNISAIPPTLPTGLSASLTVASEDSSVDLTWTAPSDDGGSAITNYVVEFGTASGVYDTAVDTTVTGTSFTVSPLSENTEYFFIVRAENSAGITGASNEDSITTFGIPELVLSFDAITANSAVVDWVIDANGGTISEIDVERSLDGVTFADIEETETLGIDFIVDGDLTANTDFYYRMTATNEFGTSDYVLSTPASIMTTNLPVIDAVSNISLRFNESYVDTIPACNDVEDGVLVTTSTGAVDSFTSGIQTITYDCQDSDGNDAISVVRSVTVANRSGGGSDERHKSSPTSGLDWKTNRQIVDGGFKMNNVSFDLDDNWHTDFAKQNVKVGSLNSFGVKTFAQNGGLWIQEFAFGIPEIGEYNDAEALVEVHYNYDKTIKETKIIQNSGVINEGSLFATTNQVSCSNDYSMMCYSTELKFIFDEPLKDDVMAIKSIDLSRRSMHPTYLNEGINVFGDSLTPSNTLQIAGTEKYEGLITVTQSEKYSDLWIAEDGRIFEMFGESDSFKLVNQEIDGTMNDRVSDELKQWTQKNALSVFDSASIQGSDKGFVTVEYPDIDTRTQFLLDHDLTGLTRGY